LTGFTADNAANSADSASADGSLFGSLSNSLYPTIDKNDEKNENDKREFFSYRCNFAMCWRKIRKFANV
jgi:hypothetical protein